MILGPEASSSTNNNDTPTVRPGCRDGEKCQTMARPMVGTMPQEITRPLVLVVTSP